MPFQPSSTEFLWLEHLKQIGAPQQIDFSERLLVCAFSFGGSPAKLRGNLSCRSQMRIQG